jgi:tRNA(Arg) A34 adenosine deaminase TadA
MAVDGLRASPQDETLLRRALAVAREARAHGNHPFGALLAGDDGRVRLEAENTVVTEGDCTGHAELNLVRAACRTLGGGELVGATIYTSTEPCAMCSGAIYWGGLARVVFGLPASELHALASGTPESQQLVLSSRDVLRHGQRSIEVLGPLLEDEARAVHEGFWDTL